MKTITLETPKETERCRCGGIGHLCVKKIKEGFFVYCYFCGKHGPVRKQILTALNAWNSETKKRRGK